MSFPDNPSLDYITLIILLIGVFLFIAGLRIIHIEKITVSPGVKTWGLGLVLIFISSYILYNSNDSDDKNTTPQSPLTNPDKSTDIQEKIQQKEPAHNPPENNNTSKDENKEDSIPINQVNEYYNLLKKKNTNDSWKYLSSNLKQKLFGYSSINPSDNYIKWWTEDVTNIDIKSVKYTNKNSQENSREIEVSLVYTLKEENHCLYDNSIIQMKKIDSQWIIYDKNYINKPLTRSCQ